MGGRIYFFFEKLSALRKSPIPPSQFIRVFVECALIQVKKSDLGWGPASTANVKVKKWSSKCRPPHTEAATPCDFLNFVFLLLGDCSVVVRLLFGLC